MTRSSPVQLPLPLQFRAWAICHPGRINMQGGLCFECARARMYRQSQQLCPVIGCLG